MATSRSGPPPTCARPDDTPPYRPGKTARKRARDTRRQGVGPSGSAWCYVTMPTLAKLAPYYTAHGLGWTT